MLWLAPGKIEFEPFGCSGRGGRGRRQGRRSTVHGRGAGPHDARWITTELVVSRHDHRRGRARPLLLVVHRRSTQVASKLWRSLCTQSSIAVKSHLSYLLVIDLVDVTGQAAGQDYTQHREYGYSERATSYQTHVALDEVYHAVVTPLVNTLFIVSKA